MMLTLAQPNQLPSCERELAEMPIGPGHLRLARQVVAAGAGVSLDQLRTLPSWLSGAGLRPGAGPGAGPGRLEVPYGYDARLAEYDAFFGVTRAEAAPA